MKTSTRFAAAAVLLCGAFAYSQSGQPVDAEQPKAHAVNGSRSPLNVIDFDADPTGDRDSTAAIQSAIDAALGSLDSATARTDARTRCRYAIAAVHLPAGTYRVSAPLRIHGAMHLRFTGDGGCTRIKPVGKLESVLDINGAANCEFANFRIEGDGKSEEVQNAIYFYWDGTGRSSERCNFHDISILGTRCVTGFRIGKPGHGGQVDTSAYRDITVYGDWTTGEKTWWQHGFYVGSDVFANCLVHSFFNPSVTHWAEGCHVSVTNFSLFGGNFGGNGADFVAHTLSYFCVQGIRSESSGQLLVSGTGSSNSSANFSLSDIVWWPDKLSPDGQVVRFLQNGTLAIRNLVIPPGPVAPVFRIAPGRACSLLLDGLTCSNTMAGLLSGLTSDVDRSVRGFVSEDPGGSGFVAASRGLDFGDGWNLSRDGLFLGKDQRWTPQALVLDTYRYWSADGFVLAKDRHWTDDGLYPGIGVKYPLGGGLIGKPDGGLYWVDWINQAATVLVRPRKGK